MGTERDWRIAFSIGSAIGLPIAAFISIIGLILGLAIHTWTVLWIGLGIFLISILLILYAMLTPVISLSSATRQFNKQMARKFIGQGVARAPMGWFSRKVPNREKEGALALVRHLQRMLAYQQLAMETYNDAVASVVGEPPHGAEVWGHAQTTFSSPVLVAEYVIPALEKKIEILQLMEAQHQKTEHLATAKLAQPYQAMTSAIRTALDRAQLQYQGFTRWVRSPQTAVDVTRLDGPEFTAVGRAASALNDLIKRVALTTEEWIEVNREAFNSVRASVELPPLDREAFRSRYFRGLTGERVRFFAD